MGNVYTPLSCSHYPPKQIDLLREEKVWHNIKLLFNPSWVLTYPLIDGAVLLIFSLNVSCNISKSSGQQKRRLLRCWRLLGILLTVLQRKLCMPCYLKFKRLLPGPLPWLLSCNECSSRVDSQWRVRNCLVGQSKTCTDRLLRPSEAESTKPEQRTLPPTERPQNK